VIAATLAEAEFQDGKLTAGWHAKLAKHNQQLLGKTASKGQIAKNYRSNYADCI